MKITYLVLGLLIGGISSFVLTKSFYNTHSTEPKKTKSDTSLIEPNWNWPDSLDAVKAAPQSHKIVYEDSTVRILQVVLEAGKTEPIHTHQWKSIMWFTQATPMTYYKYGVKNNTYIVRDSIAIPQMPPEVLNQGDFLDAEGPHAIKNSSNKEGFAYRVEFKKQFKTLTNLAAHNKCISISRRPVCGKLTLRILPPGPTLIYYQNLPSLNNQTTPPAK